MPIARSTLAGISTGVVLLAGAAGFGIGLPRVIEEPASDAAGELPVLPDRLDDRMVEGSTAFSEAIAVTTNPEYQAGLQQLADASLDADADAVASLTEVYGSATLRTYYDAVALQGSLAGQAGTQPAELSVAVIPGGGVASLTQGSKPLQSGGVAYEQRLVDGHPCSVTWIMVDQATGQPLQGEIPAANYVVQCRAERDGLAYVIDGKALLPEEVAAYLDTVLDETA